MRHLLAIAAAALLAILAGTAFAKEWKEVRIGTEGAYEPFNYYDANRNLVGFDIDIAKALCAKMQVKCTFVAQDWDGIIPALLANKYDAIVASMSITDERKKQVDFTDKYYDTPARFAVTKGSTLDLTAKGMKGKTIGAQRSTIHSSYLEDNYKDADLKFYATQEEANLDLASGRVDAVLADMIVLNDWLEKDGGCCEFAGPEVRVGGGVGIAVRKGDDELREMFNKAIAEIRKDGTYKKINAEYFPFDIY